MKSIASILNRAAELIETNGLWKGAFTSHDVEVYDTYDTVFPEDGTCARCTEGAILKALCEQGVDLDMEFGIVDKVFDVLREELGVEAIYKWNDDPIRTRDEVVGALRKTAHRLVQQAFLYQKLVMVNDKHRMVTVYLIVNDDGIADWKHDKDNAEALARELTDCHEKEHRVERRDFDVQDW